MTTPKLIREIGEALFGSRWQSELGDHLGINRRTVKRWLAGEFEPRSEVWEELEELLRERAQQQQHLCAVIRERANEEQVR